MVSRRRVGDKASCGTMSDMSRHWKSHACIVPVLMAAAFVAGIIFKHGVFAPSPGKRVKVVHVGDGDSVTLLIDDVRVSCRLIGIDCPEIGQEGWGRRCRDHTAALLARSEWSVRAEQDVESIDKYGRSLVYLFLSDGSMLNERLLRDGYAYLFTIPPNVKYTDRLRAAQRSARESGKGIWSAEGPSLRPWKYRKKHTRRKRSTRR